MIAGQPVYNVLDWLELTALLISDGLSSFSRHEQ
jgi:hypothetical protein